MGRITTTTFACLGITCLALCGCDNGYQDVTSGSVEAGSTAVPVQEKPQQSAGPAQQRSGGQPALGAARRAANRTVGQLEAHNRELQREIDKQNDN